MFDRGCRTISAQKLILLAWQRQKDKKTEIQKRPKREFNIVMSGQFYTLAMFFFFFILAICGWWWNHAKQLMKSMAKSFLTQSDDSVISNGKCFNFELTPVLRIGRYDYISSLWQLEKTALMSWCCSSALSLLWPSVENHPITVGHYRHILTAAKDFPRSKTISIWNLNKK